MSPFNSISVTNIYYDGTGGMIVTFTGTMVVKAKEENKKKEEEGKKKKELDIIDLLSDSEDGDTEEIKAEILMLAMKKREAEKKANEAEIKATDEKKAAKNAPTAPMKPSPAIKKEATKKGNTKKKVTHNMYPPTAPAAPAVHTRARATNLKIFDEDEPALDYELSQQQGW